MLGGFGARAGSSFGEFGESLGGALGVVLAGVLSSRAIVWSIKPWHRTVAWFFPGLLLALMLNWLIPSHLDLPLYRWALCGTVLGILLGSYCGPFHGILERKTESTAYLTGHWLILLGYAGILFGFVLIFLANGVLLGTLAVVLTIIVKLLSGRRLGVVLAGVEGGAFGSFWASALVAGFGGRDAAELLGGYLVIPLCGLLLGALGGGCGGWITWRITTTQVEPKTVAEINPFNQSPA